jgi:hypothetical protein
VLVLGLSRTKSRVFANKRLGGDSALAALKEKKKENSHQ